MRQSERTFEFSASENDKNYDFYVWFIVEDVDGIRGIVDCDIYLL